MTNEEAINIIEQYREKPTLINEIETVEEAVWLDEALDMAIKALEQQQNIGTWKYSHEHIYLDNGICKEWDNYYCSECDAPNSSPSNFCPQCGQKKEVVEE